MILNVTNDENEVKAVKTHEFVEGLYYEVCCFCQVPCNGIPCGRTRNIKRKDGKVGGFEAL